MENEIQKLKEVEKVIGNMLISFERNGLEHKNLSIAYVEILHAIRVLEKFISYIKDIPQDSNR